MDRNNLFPEIHSSLVGCVIQCLKQVTDQPWVRVGMKLTVANVTRSGKFQFKELKWAWGTSNNTQHKFFKVIQFPATADENIDKLRKRVRSENMNLPSMMDALDELIEFKEKQSQPITT